MWWIAIIAGAWVLVALAALIHRRSQRQSPRPPRLRLIPVDHLPTGNPGLETLRQKAQDLERRMKGDPTGDE